MEMGKNAGTLFTQPSFLFTKSLCGVYKAVSFFFFFFTVAPVCPTLTISQ
jgi:hypothetical protein